jgi:hypothetical protein
MDIPAHLQNSTRPPNSPQVIPVIPDNADTFSASDHLGLKKRAAIFFPECV